MIVLCLIIIVAIIATGCVIYNKTSNDTFNIIMFFVVLGILIFCIGYEVSAPFDILEKTEYIKSNDYAEYGIGIKSEQIGLIEKRTYITPRWGINKDSNIECSFIHFIDL